MARRYEQFGWKEKTEFLYNGKLYTPTCINAALCGPSLEGRNRFLGPCKGGSLSRWSASANILFTKGCEAQSFALLCSFAAPLMRLYKDDAGGGILSIVGAKKGSGKTTALEAAASVWGRHEGLALSDSDIKIGRESALYLLGNLPSVYDDIYARDPEVIAGFVRDFTQGTSHDGDINENRAAWKTILLLASSHSLVDVVSAVDGGDGDDFRILEFISELPKGIRKRGELKRDLKANSGWAGDAYLRRLVQPEIFQYVRSGLPKWTDQVWAYTGLDQKHRLDVRIVAAVIAAGIVVRNMGILEFSPSRIATWAMDTLKDQAAKRTMSGAHDPMVILAEFVRAHRQDMLVVEKKWDHSRHQPQPVMTPTGGNGVICRYEIKEGRLLIKETRLRSWLKQTGITWDAFSKSLYRSGVMLREARKVGLGAGTIYSSGPVSVTELDAKHPDVLALLKPAPVSISSGPASSFPRSPYALKA